MQSSEFDAEISIGTEIPDQEPLGEALPQEALPSYEPGQGAADLSTSSVIYHGDDDNGKLKFLVEPTLGIGLVTVCI